MSTFDKIMIILNAGALAGAGISTGGGAPKWLVIACVIVAAGTGAVAPSLVASKRAPAPEPGPLPKP